MDLSRTQVELVSNAYKKIINNIEILRERKSAPLTLAEKLLFGPLAFHQIYEGPTTYSSAVTIDYTLLPRRCR